MKELTDNLEWSEISVVRSAVSNISSTCVVDECVGVQLRHVRLGSIYSGDIDSTL